ncbi:hypothetical protein [Desulfothermobacter acidiphilus]|uniref:hypothetical protein n=1 Tax=Desulfothermobacter acidiphilus TaxID=1938353 RepID=UPI003F8C8640
MVNQAAVVGLGDLFRRDVGVGSWAIEFLSRSGLSAHVELVDLGTALGYLDTYLYRCSYVLLLQAWPQGSAPGKIRQLSARGLERWLGKSQRGHLSFPFCSSPCTLFQDALVYLGRMHRLGVLRGELTLLGVEPKDVSPGVGLSSPVRRVFPRFLRAVYRHLEKQGCLPPGFPVVVPLHRCGSEALPL